MVDEQRHQYVEQLELSEEKYRTLFEHIGDSVLILEHQTFRVLDVNENAARRLGYSREELLTMHLHDIEVALEGPNLSIPSWKSFHSGTRIYECGYRHKNGDIIPVEVSSRIMKTGDQEIWINLVRDITHRKQIENNLQEANDRLQLLRKADNLLTSKLDIGYVLKIAVDIAIKLSYADTGLISVIADDKVLLSHAIGAYHHFAPESLPLDQGIVARIRRQQVPELIQDVSQDADYVAIVPETRAQMVLPLISNQRLIGILNLETHNPDYFTIDTFEFIQLLATRIAAALDNAHAYEEMRLLAEDLDAFSHTVAHDLKNPLSTMMGYTFLLTEDLKGQISEEHMSYLRNAQQSSEKMVDIINELLLLASVRKLEEIEVKPLDMAAIVGEALTRLDGLIAKTQAQIYLPENNEWPQVIGYAPWIEAVWTNYISNAIKYGGEPPKILLGATVQPDGMVRFGAQDNGPGISMDKQMRLFKTFTRLDQARAQGHGLGLSIVKRIVQKLDGEVGVYSEVGRGSIFTFTLPQK